MIKVSPSQISTHDSCKRRWAYSRTRPRGPSGPAAELGNKTHFVLEGWLRDGKPPDASTKAGRIAMPGLQLLPMPGVAAVERTFAETWGGVVYRGRIDFVFPKEPKNVVVIGDHKTTSKWDRTKTPDQLLSDPQRIIYSFWAVQTFQVQSVVAYWVYYSTTTRAAKSVQVHQSAEQITADFTNLHNTKTLKLVQQTGIPPEQVPRQLGTTCQYCDFRIECLDGLTKPQLMALQLANAYNPAKDRS